MQYLPGPKTWKIAEALGEVPGWMQARCPPKKRAALFGIAGAGALAGGGAGAWAGVGMGAGAGAEEEALAGWLLRTSTRPTLNRLLLLHAPV